MKKLRIVLSDQLTKTLSSLNGFDPKKDTLLMMEVTSMFTHVSHHPKKIVFILSSMRHFYEEVRKKYPSHYIKLTSKKSHGTYTKTLQAYLKKAAFDEIVLTAPSEFDTLKEFEALSKKVNTSIRILPDTRFFCSIEDFQRWAKGKKTLLMETFYRMQRKQEEILIEENGNPSGGKWNFDRENRNPVKEKLTFPKPKSYKPDKITEEVLDLVKKKFSKNFGAVEPFSFAVTEAQAKEALDHFIKHSLKNFGTYQDAMLDNEHTLFHSMLSQYLNIGLITAREVCQKVEQAYKSKIIPINSAEGFIRQILGWREFIRGIYWTFMPEYKNKNTLKAKKALPGFYWGKTTEMHCMRCVIKQTEASSQSHHIQRLMVTGNFALIAGLDPKEVCYWYLSVYADAYEWVELPNTLGMALYGDGGIVGSKPYAASGNYINRMSNFCKNCRFNVKKRVGKDACPFNFLYWDFLMRHEKKLRKNPRMKLIYGHVDRLQPNEKKEIKKEAKNFLSQFD